MGKLLNTELIRCPYCVESDHFKLMVLQEADGWFLCDKCGHLSLPSDPFFHCTCGKCQGLNLLVKPDDSTRSSRSKHS